MSSWADLVGMATQRSITISLAESCTGGLISSSITDVPGASKCFLGSVITYSNESKISLLKIEERTLLENGAVSNETALAMARGCRELFGSDISLAVTGIAGPDGGTEEKPVGTVHISISRSGMDPVVNGFILHNLDRGMFKEEVSKLALEMLVAIL